MLSVTFDQDIESQLETLGAKSESSKIALIREAVLEALTTSMEDIEIARARLETPARRWTQLELEQDADLEG